MQNPRSPHLSSISRTRKVLVASSIVLAGLSLGAGTAGAFPNGPVIIQDDPQPPPPPPQPPMDFDSGIDDGPQPLPGPQDWANPEPAPQPPAPMPGPNGNGNGGGGGGGGGGGQGNGGDEQDDSGPRAGADTSAEDTEALAALVAAAGQADAAAADVAAAEVDGTVGKEADRPAPDGDTVELAAGPEVAADSSSSVPTLLAGLLAVLIAGAVGLWLLLTARRKDDDGTVAA